MTCRLCHTFLDESWSSQVPRSKFVRPRILRIKSSTKDSCYICHRIFARREELFPQAEGYDMTLDPLDNTSVLKIIVSMFKHEDVIRIKFFRFTHAVDCLGFPVYGHESQLDLLLISPKAFSAPDSLNTLGDGTSMESCGRTVSQWIQFCTRYHSTCNQFWRPGWYPTRLLDLGQSFGDTTKTSVRLIETRDTPVSGPYVTLSHCWGNATIYKLEKDTLAQFKKGINLDHLPKTFVEAIAVARYLRMRYIWIDSLTIVQDDEEDWTRESSAMEQVYQNSFCNIGATGSDNSHGGLFFERQPDFLLSKLVCLGGQQMELKWNESWDNQVNNQPLMRRAWAVQERWLSPRMLHFCRDQVYWECNTGSASEVSPVLGVNYTLKLKALPTESDTAKDLAERWNWMVYFYSHGQLTFAKDKLIAFSGMARAMQRMLKDRYVGGLWEKDFIFHLTWIAQRRNTATHKRPQEYIAPSWSWASMNCITRYQEWWETRNDEGQTIRELTTVSNIHLENVGADPFGQIMSGHVRLTGPLAEVKLSNELDIYHHGHELAAFNYPDVWPRDDDDDDDDEEGINLIFLGLYLVSAPLSLEEYFEATGILLKKVPGSAATFSRVGFCHIFDAKKHPSPDFNGTLNTGHSSTNSKNFMSGLVQPTRIGSLSDELFDPERGYAIKII